ncbi:sigma-54-dependent Fis family transcriptional regulator [Brevibacillus sp. WF146]|uniref:sigma-54-dependent Fis family transcriptional regulator n=1 Tax=Brevibacillus sp. WF146 TaxID=319501 RepID=UPI0007EC3B3E|nr:sigma-54-dependent Fis family transcriptional regulator [Brevibacillus sp. WF146]UYZ14385.1 sigma-54-dependent Fis family transcriptional regulator [Brevibacillus sp. WF146]
MSFQVSLSDCPPDVSLSWKRSHERGLKPDDKADDQIITGTLIKELIDRHRSLVNHAETVFSRLYPVIRQFGCVVFLTDREGTILYASGDADFASRAAQVQLQVGANWHESRKGTNAIGVAIEEKRPALVRGSEHYFVENRFLTCASAPLYGKSGDFLGVINISGLHDRFQPVFATFAPLAAELLQNRFMIEEMEKEQLITLRHLEAVSDRHPLPLLTLDADRRVTGANRAALRLLGEDCLGQAFSPPPHFQVIPIKDETQRVYRSVAIGTSPAREKTVRQEQGLYTFADIYGECPAILRAKDLARKAAGSPLAVLITGESGTGKELFAQAIHAASGRGPFVAVNCSAIPDTLIESELFGYEKGAFTGAQKEGSPGKFLAANGGTIFLDEIGDMSLRAQAALLRVLQEKTVTPVGSAVAKQVDVRVIAATHRNLPAEVQAGRFRADLYYRLKGITLHLPALRERSDLRQLAGHLLRKHADTPAELSPEALDKLCRHTWPGNIRELLAVLQQASFLAEGAVIRPEHVMLDDPGEREDTPSSLRRHERKAIEEALLATRGNISQAARLLHIGRNTLYRKIKGYGIRLGTEADKGRSRI